MNTSHTAFGGDFSSKQALRQQHELWRRALLPKQVASRGLQVFKQLQSLPFWNGAGCFALYAAQAFEVPTSGVLTALLEAQKRVCFPTAAFQSPSLAFVRSLEDLEPGRHGLLFPKPCCLPAALAEVELIVVPGVAFAHNGVRLGRGGGFYDRLLAHPESRALRVGLCFEECLLESLPEEAHDVRMHWVVTDTQCLRLHP